MTTTTVALMKKYATTQTEKTKTAMVKVTAQTRLAVPEIIVKPNATKTATNIFQTASRVRATIAKTTLPLNPKPLKYSPETRKTRLHYAATNLITIATLYRIATTNLVKMPESRVDFVHHPKFVMMTTIWTKTTTTLQTVPIPIV